MVNSHTIATYYLQKRSQTMNCLLIRVITFCPKDQPVCSDSVYSMCMVGTPAGSPGHPLIVLTRSLAERKAHSLNSLMLQTRHTSLTVIVGPAKSEIVEEEHPLFVARKGLHPQSAQATESTWEVDSLQLARSVARGQCWTGRNGCVL